MHFLYCGQIIEISAQTISNTFCSFSYLILINLINKQMGLACINSNARNEGLQSLKTLKPLSQKTQSVKPQVDVSREEINNLTFMCILGYKIEKICVNENCKNDSLCCSSARCALCSKNHEKCQFQKIQQLKENAWKALQIQKQIMFNLFEVQERLIQNLIEARKQFIQRKLFWRIERQFQKYFNPLFNIKDNGKGIKGSQMKSLFQSLSDKGYKRQYNRQLQTFKNEGERLLNELQNARNLAIQQIVFTGLSKDIWIKTKSKIIQHSIQAKQQEKYLLKQLANPKQLRLLFRASEHNFQAAQFHKYCDKIPNTVTIIQTEFKKTVAAFTPLSWGQGSASNSDFFDESNKSFLLQLDLKQKMSLKEPGAIAIQDRSDFGPIFGGCDIIIYDKCNQNLKSYANFPYSYNLENRYENNQQSWRDLIGAQSGYYFRVLEYEVFQVIS